MWCLPGVWQAAGLAEAARHPAGHAPGHSSVPAPAHNARSLALSNGALGRALLEGVGLRFFFGRVGTEAIRQEFLAAVDHRGQNGDTFVRAALGGRHAVHPIPLGTPLALPALCPPASCLPSSACHRRGSPLRPKAPGPDDDGTNEGDARCLCWSDSEGLIAKRRGVFERELANPCEADCTGVQPVENSLEYAARYGENGASAA